MEVSIGGVGKRGLVCIYIGAVAAAIDVAVDIAINLDVGTAGYVAGYIVAAIHIFQITTPDKNVSSVVF